MPTAISTQGVLSWDAAVGTAGHAAAIIATAVALETLQRALCQGRLRNVLVSLLGRGQSREQLSRDVYQAVIRIIGFMHLAVQLPVAMSVLRDPHMGLSKLYARTVTSQAMLLLSGGYFLHDLYSCVTRFRDWGSAYLLHSLVCCTLYSYGALTGFLHYYGAVFLLWEASTPFVYIRWFLHKTGRTDSLVYTANGLMMLAAFFSFRIVFGIWSSYDFFKVTSRELAWPQVGGISPHLIWLYRLANISLNMLNLFWFYKMAVGAVKLLSGKANKRKD